MNCRRRTSGWRRGSAIAAAAATITFWLSTARGQDWPMWGGSPSRNNAPQGENIPTVWNVGEFDRETGKWDRSSARNVKWTAQLGSQTYGNPVAAGGRVFVGTNNQAGYVKRYPPDVDLGCLLCFRESDGEFTWQYSSEKLPTGRVHDWPLQGICSAPLVEGDRMWLVTNRGEVLCLDPEGFYDGEDDGPVVGQWITLWNTFSTISAALGRYKIVEELQVALDASGVKPPPDLRVGSVRNSASKELYTGDYRRRETWAQIASNGNQIEVYLIEPQPNVKRRLLCTVEDRRFADLDQRVLPEAIRQQAVKLGFAPTDAALRAVSAKREWRLAATSEAGTCEMRILRDQNSLRLERRISPLDRREADVVWKYDMMSELGVSQHNMATCAPAAWGDTLFICTSNGIDESHVKIPAPDAPSFIALDKRTGELLWTDNSPGSMILHGQWSAPAVGVLGGIPQVIFPGGDGWVYSFRADRFSNGRPELLWKFDGNPKESKWALGGRGTRNNIIAIPVIHDGLVYIVMGQDPEHGEGVGHLWCIDPTKRGDVSPELVVTINDRTRPVSRRRAEAIDAARGEIAIDNPKSAVVWDYNRADRNGDGKLQFEEEFHRSIGSVAIKDGLLFTADFSGLAHCLDAKSGKAHWTCDLFAQCWSSPLIVEDNVYIGDEDGDVAIFKLSADPAASIQQDSSNDGSYFYAPANELNMGNSVYTAPMVANGVLYIATKDRLFAIAHDQQAAPKPPPLPR